jgi:hypothetical protein
MKQQNIISEIAKAIAQIQGAQFLSFTYLSKGAGELARHTLIAGFNYHTLVEKSVKELETIIALEAAGWSELQKQAANEVLASLNKTLAAHARGEQNEDYTKRGQYIPVGNGMNLNTADNTLQFFGLAHQKAVLVPGVYPNVKSRPLTLAKNEIRDRLSVAKFREFAVDLENVASVRVAGNTIEFVPVG